MGNPPFVDLIAGSCLRFHVELSTPTILASLKVIGCMDLLLALILLIRLPPRMLAFMAFWGLITALSRPLAMGPEVWYLTTERIANFGLPLCLFLLKKEVFFDSTITHAKRYELLHS